ncbi:RAI1-domain-containing protein [Patellaria atrata CBS 101060]|uniref:Decapping nuclease n=1 Tax=Patellaria atrata CBS 101060 TaxID=1346257 RepID=A0A9P4VRX5_9PEZI|nr:RAI1-domain-containing protein [Patellaria atrata CBS 101060]
MSSFPIEPVDRFVGQGSAIRKPEEIACFSYDEEHKFRLDDSSLKYYYPPKLGANLCAGFNEFKKLDTTADDGLNSLLKTILEKEKETGELLEVDFITWRGMMTKIMAAPYDRFNDFDMNATLFQGTIYIEEDHATKWALQQKQSGQQPRRGQPSQDMMSFWGYKFETISLIPDVWDKVSRETIENREHEIVSNHAQYCSVVRTGLGSSSLILGGEVDAVWDRKLANRTTDINWVELKTAEEPNSSFSAQKFERKLLKFWVQSFLLGVPRIIVGFRSPQGILQRLDEYKTNSIPGKVKREGQYSWDGNVCINFASAFLEFLKATITGDGVWRIHCERGHPITVYKISEAGHGSILSEEFLQWRQQTKQE